MAKVNTGKLKKLNSNMYFKWDGNLAKEVERKAARKAIKDVAEDILEDSNKMVPFDDGDLLRSGDTDAEVSYNTIRATIYYDTPYAARLHEHPEYNFQNGREGKYLEKAVENRRQDAKDYIASEYKKAFK